MKFKLKRIDWYIIKQFLGTYIFAIALIIAISVVFDINEKIDKFLSPDVPLKAIVFDYYMNFIPYFANLFSPLFTFIAVIFFTSKLADNSEVIAMLASGMSFRRLMLPYAISAFQPAAHSGAYQKRRSAALPAQESVAPQSPESHGKDRFPSPSSSVTPSFCTRSRSRARRRQGCTAAQTLSHRLLRSWCSPDGTKQGSGRTDPAPSSAHRCRIL